MVYCSKCGGQNADGARFCNHCAAPLGVAPQVAPQGAQQQAPAQQTAQPQQELPPQLQPGQKATLLDYISHYKGLQLHWVKRFVALVFDFLFIMLPVYVILVFLIFSLGGWWSIGLGGVVLFLYSAFFESAYGVTIGKAILGLRVFSTKGKLDLSDTLVRNITKVIPPLLILEFVVSLVVETTDAHQRYLDKLAKTTVVEKT